MTMERFRRSDAIRDALRDRWPLCAFTVRLEGKPGRSTTRIAWTDGPTEDQVRAVAYDHDGRRYVTLDRRLTGNLAGAPPDLPAAGPVGTTVLLGTPIPYDDACCAICGGELRVPGKDAARFAVPGEPVRHVATRSVYCPCSRCGCSTAGATLVDGAVVCPTCQHDDDLSEPGFLPVAGPETPGSA